LNKIRILENDEQKKTNPNSNEAFELGFVDSLRTLHYISVKSFLYFTDVDAKIFSIIKFIYTDF
ncbi:hypothetical protein, partial [Tepidibacillus fermentans]